MVLFPFVVIGLGAVTYYANYRSDPPKSEAQAATTTTVTPEVVVSNLDTPWSMQFAPDGRLYFTERPGRIRVYENGQLRANPVATISNTETLNQEEGLQGLALHPNFASNGWLYVYYTYTSGSNLKNRLARYTLNPSTGTVTSGPTTLIEDIPGYKFHNGGRIKFGPDSKLYITTGSATPDTVSQDTNSLGGKILRVNDDGSAAAGNPFGNRVYSYGHRNPQGIAWHPVTGELWSTEHGPSGASPYCCNDEINKIVPGANYGWPRYYGSNGEDSNYSYFNITQTKPIYTSGTSSKWAPGGAMFYSGGPLASPWTNSLIFAGLGGIDKSNQALFRLRLSADGKTPTQLDTLYKSTYGRIRDVVQGPDGAIYFTTSNKDGRGTAQSGDDRIIRLKPTGLPTTPTPPPPATPPPTTPPPTAPPPSTSGQTPYTSAIPIPGRLEAENYDKGGQGVAYNDTTTANEGGKYRADGVDIEDSTEGGYSIGWVKAGEWLGYTTNISTTGKYNLTFRVATTGTGAWTLKEGNTVLATANVTNTGGWYAWKDVGVNNVNLTAGSKVLRLEASGGAVNLNYVTFVSQTTGGGTTPTPAPPPSAPPATPRPPVSVPGANTSTPVKIPSTLPKEQDGSLVADFNGDGLNEVARDLNNDGEIDPTTEIIIDGSTNPELTDTSELPNEVLETPESNSNTVTIKAGPLPEVKLAKPVAYTFAIAQVVAITGLGAYLAITKLAIFAGLRGRLGL